MDTMDDDMEARIDHGKPNPVETCEEDDASSFGPWMLIARRRGRSGGRGGAGGGAERSVSRAAHASLAASPNVSPNVQLHDDTIQPTRGISSFRSRGGHVGGRSRASVTLPVLLETPVSDLISSGSQDIGTLISSPSLVPKNSDPIIPPDPGPSSSTAVSSKEKTLSSSLTLAHPPSIRISDGLDGGDPLCPPNPSHALVVAQVFVVLNPSPSLESSDHLMSDSGEEDSDEDDGDSEMSEYDDTNEPNDSMTLIQYQSGIRKEALARRDPQPISPSNKKGRIGSGDDVI